MPACTLHLISLASSVSIASFVSHLRAARDVQTLLVAKVIRWVITPTQLSVSALLHPIRPYDLFIVTHGLAALPSALTALTVCHWTIPAGIPSRLTTDFATKNDTLLHPNPSTIVPLTGSLSNPQLSTNSQDLTLSPELRAWIDSFSQSTTTTANATAGLGPVTMLNLLAFRPNKKDSYLAYGRAFADSIGARRGGTAKLVGNVLDKARHDGWDEIAVAHYPSILHFADMLTGDDYQEVNQRDRVPALRDTCILCTSEIALEEEMIRGGGGRVKL